MERKFENLSTSQSERMCIVTRETHARADCDELVRFVVGPDNKIVPDIRNKLPGRGVWVSTNRNRVLQAVSSKAFARAMKRSVEVEEQLPDVVADLLKQSALGALGISKKAGDCVAGLSNVKKVVEQGRAIGIFHAMDGSEDGYVKLKSSLRRNETEKKNAPPVLRVFDSEQLGLALGATNVIHAALLNGGAGRNCMLKIARLVAYENLGIQN